MAFQFTTLTTTIDSIAMLGAWAFVTLRSRRGHAALLRPVQLLNNFFVDMGLFFIIMSAPGIWLSADPGKFPQYMAWGYVVGHIFLYLGLINIASMLFTIIPRLAAKEWIVPIVGWIALVAITAFNAATMIWGTQPSFNYAKHVTQFNANPLVGAAIAVFGLLTFLPAGVLFLRNAFRSSGPRRTRSLLLGLGFCMFVIAGPPHDVAGNWQTYMIGDILAIASGIMVAIGVAYRLEQNLSLEGQPSPASGTTSNTV